MQTISSTLNRTPKSLGVSKFLTHSWSVKSHCVLAKFIMLGISFTSHELLCFLVGDNVKTFVCFAIINRNMVVGVTLVTYASVIIQLLFLIGHLYLISVWFGEDQRADTIQTHVKIDWTMSLIFINYSTLNMANTIEGTYAFD